MPLLEYLARNESKYSYKATAEDTMVQLARMLIAAEGAPDEQAVLEDVLARATRAGSHMSGVMLNPVVRGMLVELIAVGKHFREMKEMKISWWTANLSAIEGGVSG